MRRRHTDIHIPGPYPQEVRQPGNHRIEILLECEKGAFTVRMCLLIMVRRNFMYLLRFQCCLLICWLLETLRPAFIGLCDHGFVCQLLLHLGADARPLSLQHPLSL